MSEPEVLVEVVDGVGRLVLNRPRAINALSLAMIRLLHHALADFAADDAVRRVVLVGAGERGLCSGADVRELREQALAGDDPGVFLREEYLLDLAIAAYPKPYTAVMDGITMGGGLGLSAHCADRVVTHSSRLAMPETQIGLFPDVFMTWRLARMPHAVGTHLALTGDTVNAADALWLGLADRSAGGLPAPVLQPDHAWITECYAGADPVEIVGRLAQHSHPAARAAAEVLEQRCPLSLHVTLEALRRAGETPRLADQFDRELQVATTLAAGPDFAEGVRAQLVDRDRSPRWSHESLADVSRTEVLACFGEA
jgi:enoyl-CoA hydratase